LQELIEIMRSVFRFLVFLGCLCQVMEGAWAQGFGGPDFERMRKETQEDHQDMLRQLGIERLRPGVNGNDPNAPNAANYDESKANPYPELPDPLQFRDGTPVTDAAGWERRRLETLEDFDREVYGRVPANLPPVRWEVTGTSEETRGDLAVKVERVEGHVDPPEGTEIRVDIQLTVGLPAAATGPVPVVMEFGFGAFPGRFGNAPGAPAPPPPAWQTDCIRRGWGYAVIVPNSVQADNGAGLVRGIIGLRNRGRRRSPEDWGALRAWAWGGSRALDYFEAHDGIDATRVTIGGHSRYGKAALVAMAYDTRFAAGYISSSGAAGAKLHRRNAGELVENIASSGEYHWMAGNYIKYAGPLQWSDLPVDAHQLIALCAPRPVFISSGLNGDSWVDARGMFMATAAASPVYELLGKRGVGTEAFPPVETGLLDGELAFRQHSGGHTPGPNYPYFLDFAARYFDR
jgi:hypothetical protein